MTKHIIICSSVLLIFAFLTPGFADEHFPFLAKISKDSVNLRAGPSVNFKKIDTLNKGDQVVVLGRNYEWVKIQPLATTKEYIRADYLKIKEGQDLAVVLGNNVNIRCSADSDAASLGEIKKGALVKVLEQANGWCRLAPVAGTAAWVHQDFVKKASSAYVPSSLLLAPIGVNLQGTLQALPEPLEADVHYEIVTDKSTYYLKDMPQIALFENMVVTVEGNVIPQPPPAVEDSSKSQEKPMHPLLHINKIALVL